MENSNTIKIIVKAANQKNADFAVDCELNWSVRYLKSYLSKNYPTKLNEDTIRLIYSGRQLNDESLLKECIRLNSETSVHNIHMVYKPTNPIEEDVSNKANLSTLIDDDRVRATTTSQTASFQQQNFEQMTPKEQHQAIYSQLRNYYSAMGVSMSSSWNISYLQHTALYYQMYSNYMRSIDVNVGFELNNNLHLNNINTNNTDTNNNNENVPNNNNNQPANNADADIRPEDRENDWLSLLNNLCSFFVLFSFVYFYSTFVRFMIVLLAVVLLILYHSGWFALERRNIRNERPNPPQTDENNQANNNEDTPAGVATETPAGPSVLRLIISFIVTFFTSLIPERARIPN